MVRQPDYRSNFLSGLGQNGGDDGAFDDTRVFCEDGTIEGMVAYAIRAK
jgi:hypothetical protein